MRYIPITFRYLALKIEFNFLKYVMSHNILGTIYLLKLDDLFCITETGTVFLY